MKRHGTDVLIFRSELLTYCESAGQKALFTEKLLNKAVQRGHIAKAEKRGEYSYNHSRDAWKKLFREALCQNLHPLAFLQREEAGQGNNAEAEQETAFRMRFLHELPYWLNPEDARWFENALEGKAVNQEKINRRIAHLQEATAVLRFLEGICTKAQCQVWQVESKRELYVQVGRIYASYRHNKALVFRSSTPQKMYSKLLQKVTAFRKTGKESLLPAGFGNQNRRKVGKNQELLLVALMADQRKPDFETVKRDFNLFMGGKIELMNPKTGEVLNPTDYYYEGKPIRLSSETVRRYVTRPLNHASVALRTMSSIEYAGHHKPYVQRDLPLYAGSLLTIDDRDLPYQTPNGSYLKCYLVFDVASKAVLGVAYGERKDTGLFLAAIADMYRNLYEWGWQWQPYELQTERHIAWDLRGNETEANAMTNGEIFPYIQFAKGGNAREKYAEMLIGSIKKLERAYSESFKHRPFAKRPQDRRNQDAKMKALEYDEVANQLNDRISQWNNSPWQPGQGQQEHAQFIGSRLEYFRQYPHDRLPQQQPEKQVRWLGETINKAAKLHHQQILNAGGQQWQLQQPLTDLKSGYLEVKRLPWIKNQVWAVQEGKVLGMATPPLRAMAARLERTEVHEKALGKQYRYGQEVERAAKERQHETEAVKPITRPLFAEPPSAFPQLSTVAKAVPTPEPQGGIDYSNLNLEKIYKPSNNQ